MSSNSIPKRESLDASRILNISNIPDKILKDDKKEKEKKNTTIRSPIINPTYFSTGGVKALTTGRLNFELLSGPVGWYHFTHNGRNFHFLTFDFWISYEIQKSKGSLWKE